MSSAAAVGLLEAEVGRAFPAAALAWGEAGKERLLCAVGEATLSTWFDLASLTKALCTSLLAMRCVAAGCLDLEEEVWPGVSVALLLAHGSGLPAWRPLFAEVPPGPRAREAMVAAAAATPRGPAGVAAVYSDLGYIVLGDLLERRGGDRLDRLFAPLAHALGAELGFRPVGEAAAVPPWACAPTRRETPARELLQGEVHDDNARAMGGVAGHAGLFGTVGGVSRLLQALVEAWQGRDPGLGIPTAVLHRFLSARPVPGATWALGWDRPDPHPGRSAAGDRWSRQGLGHLGFTGCSAWMDPPAGRWVVLLSNRVAAPTTEAAEAARLRLQLLRPRLHDALLE
ncbi:MAG: serine hydrolase [Myxococcales bacterium]|nr:serine hydrolase [Myxococcota bacterium]MDW8282767.1 serine hydrolase [Myxococcales bacterium]